MVAMLVPQKLSQCVVWRGHQVDVGMTLIHIMNNLQDQERALDLGGQQYGLSYEMHLAWQELSVA